MERLADTPELLDGPLPDLDELAGNLRDLARVNRWLWGTALSHRALERLLAPDGRDGAARVRLLDVGTGAADIPAALLARPAPRRLEVVALDSRAEVLAAARRLDPLLDRRPGLTLRVADGRRLPFEDDAFDVAHASLLLHHLEPPEAIALLGELARVARAVVVNDLVRSRRAVLGARVLASTATRNRLTRHDAPLSVRRSYTESELRALLARAGLSVVGTFRDPFRHRVALAALPSAAAGTGS